MNVSDITIPQSDLFIYLSNSLYIYIMQIISVVHKMIYIPARLFHLKYTYGMLVI